jgi:hypothetical protein
VLIILLSQSGRPDPVSRCARTHLLVPRAGTEEIVTSFGPTACPVSLFSPPSAALRTMEVTSEYYIRA